MYYSWIFSAKIDVLCKKSKKINEAMHIASTVWWWKKTVAYLHIN